MAEGVIYEGMGRPKAGPVEWVKQKLAARYTEKGRIKHELAKIEKVMGPLSDEQKQQAAEKMHLEGKIKNKVVFTVVKDAVVGTVVVATAVYLGKRPDVRGNIASFMSRNTKAAGVVVSENLNVGIAKLQPLGNEKQSAFKKLLSSMMTGVDKVVVNTTGKAGELLDKAAQASVRSTTGRVINAEKAANVLAEKFKSVAADKMPKSVGTAAENVKKWELREAAVRTTAEANQYLDYGSIANARESQQQYTKDVLEGVADAFRDERPLEAAKRAIARKFDSKSGVKPYEDAFSAAIDAHNKVLSDLTSTPEAKKLAADAGFKASLELEAAKVLAKEAAEKAARIAADKLARETVKAAKKVAPVVATVASTTKP